MAIQLSGSLQLTGSLFVDGDPVVLANQTSSLSVSSASFASTASYADAFTVAGEIVAQTLNVQQVTSSVVYSSGSNVFGNDISNTQQFTGSVGITGSLSVNGTSAVTGTGTTNYLPKFTGSITIGNSVIQEASSLIGINVTPTRVLHLASSGTNAAIRLDNTTSGRPFLLAYDDSQNLTFINSSDSGYTAFNSGTGASTTKMLLTNSGNLGLGVTPSAWFSGVTALQFGSAGALWSNSDRANLASNTFIDAATNAKYIANGFALRYAQENGSHIWFQAGSGTANDPISFTQAMTLNASGNLSIGNTNDTYKLDVSGTGRFIAGSGDPIFRVMGGGDGTGGGKGNIRSSDQGGVNYWDFGRDNLTTGNFVITTGGGSPILTLTTAGAATFASSVTANNFISPGTVNSTNAVCSNYMKVYCDTSDTRYLQLYMGNPSTYNPAAANSICKIVSGIQFNWYSENWTIGATRGGGADIDSFVLGRNNVTSVAIGSTGVTCFSNTICAPTGIFSGCVGIGTTDPSTKLDVVGNMKLNTYMMFNATPGYPGMIGFNRNVDNAAIFNPSYGAYQLMNNEGEFQFQVYNSSGTQVTVHRFLNNGNVSLNCNVGIGNTSPLTKLVVNNAIAGNVLPYIQGTGLSYNNEGISVAGSNTNNTNIGNGLTLYNNVSSVGAYSPVVAWSSMTPNGAYNSTYAFITGVYGGAGGDANWAIGDLILGTAAEYGATEKMRIKHNGNVGIGTDNPGSKLDVSGLINISNGFGEPSTESAYRLRFYDNGGVHNDPGIGLDGSGGGGEQMWFNALGGFYWGFGTSGTKMKLASTGITCFANTVCAPTFKGKLIGRAIISEVSCALSSASNDVTIYFTSGITIEYGVNDYTVLAYQANNSAINSSLRALIPYNYYQSSPTTTNLASYIDSPNGHTVLAVGICKLVNSNTYCVAVRFAKSSGGVTGNTIQLTANGVQQGFS